jgi:hypothetical protein
MSSVFVVCLREPGFKTDYREDPYWETGSFGCTGCHSRNLFNPTGQHLHDGAQLAFAQGGPDGTKLLFVTPEIEMRSAGRFVEAKWQPGKMPLKYANAPLLIDASGRTDFPLFKAFISTSRSKNWRHKFSSKFRSRARRLDPQVAMEVVTVYELYRSAAPTSALAMTYMDAIPTWPEWEVWSKTNRPWLPSDRRAAYKKKRRELSRADLVRCGVKGKRCS